MITRIICLSISKERTGEFRSEEVCIESNQMFWIELMSCHHIVEIIKSKANAQLAKHWISNTYCVMTTNKGRKS